MMNCEQSQERMIDVLYGEEVNPRQGFEFFQHLSECPGCNREYMELVETREILGEWKVGHQNAKEGETRQAVLTSRPWLGQVRWWPLLQKIAAGFLIVVGVVSILQLYGISRGQASGHLRAAAHGNGSGHDCGSTNTGAPVDAQGLY